MRVVPDTSEFVRITPETEVAVVGWKYTAGELFGCEAFLDALHARCAAQPPQGVLLLGEAGCGKTAIARQCASRSGLPVVFISAELVLAGRELLRRSSPPPPHAQDTFVTKLPIAPEDSRLLLDDLLRTRTVELRNTGLYADGQYLFPVLAAMLT